MDFLRRWVYTLTLKSIMTLRDYAHRSGASSVSSQTVIRHWLEEELEDEGTTIEEVVDGDDDSELASALFERKPIAKSVFEDRKLEWYKLELPEHQLRRLQVVKGSAGDDWRKVAPDNQLETAAQRIRTADDVDQLDEEIPKNVEKILGIADDLSNEIPMSEPIVVEEEDHTPYAIDGNHRLAGLLVYFLRGGTDPGQPVYAGFESERE